MNRRAELSMEVIIIAAIALLVLVILTVLIIRSSNNVVGGTSCTSVSGGQCVPSGSSCDAGYSRSGLSCPTQGDVCCVPVGQQQGQ